MGITNSDNQWDCYQQLKVPAGYYKVSCQGFEKGTQKTVLYAWSKPEGSYVEKTQRLPAYDGADFSSGDDQKNAAIAFNNNKYNVELAEPIKVGSDGVLVVGVKKTGNNSTKGWQVFDNFQIQYLGAAEPAAAPDVNGDGNVDLHDVYALIDILFGTARDIHGSADIDDDGRISIKDLAKLIEILQK